MVEVDVWNDEEINKRGSTHLILSCGACLDALSCRKSETDPTQLVLMLGMPLSFTDLEKKLAHLIPRIMSQYDCTVEVA